MHRFTTMHFKIKLIKKRQLFQLHISNNSFNPVFKFGACSIVFFFFFKNGMHTEVKLNLRFCTRWTGRYFCAISEYKLQHIALW